MSLLEIHPVALILIVTMLVGGCVVGVFEYLAARHSRSKKRLAAVMGKHQPGGRQEHFGRNSLKNPIDDVLKQLEERRKASLSGKPSLSIRIQRTGLKMTKKIYYSSCVVSAGICFLIAAIAINLNILLALVIGISCGLALPHFYIKLMAQRRGNRFSAAFPDAVDLIVRGLRSGLPLSDSIRMISGEAQEPVRTEFKLIVEDLTLGVTLEEAVQRLWDRVPLAETAFFGTVIALQSRTGGSLSEALGNLSKVMRDRKKLQGKIKAMSAEAKASAGIIGSLPVVVCAIVYVTSPNYMEILFTTHVGNMVLIGCLIWMAIGILVMRKMIQFNY